MATGEVPGTAIAGSRTRDAPTAPSLATANPGAAAPKPLVAAPSPMLPGEGTGVAAQRSCGATDEAQSVLAAPPVASRPVPWPAPQSHGEAPMWEDAKSARVDLIVEGDPGSTPPLEDGSYLPPGDAEDFEAHVQEILSAFLAGQDILQIMQRLPSYAPAVTCLNAAATVGRVRRGVETLAGNTVNCVAATQVAVPYWRCTLQCWWVPWRGRV